MCDGNFTHTFDHVVSVVSTVFVYRYVFKLKVKGNEGARRRKRKADRTTAKCRDSQRPNQK